MIDYHTHTWRCRHARGTVDDYVRSAIDLGLDEVGISDHYPMDILGFPPGVICSMPARELHSYVREVREAARRYHSQIAVRLGVEVDYMPGAEELLSSLVENGDWDYTIGSVHFLGDTDITHSDNSSFFCARPLADIYAEYFATVRAMVRSGIFHVLGHADAVKKHGHVPGSGSSDQLRELYEQLARLCAERDQVVEINTAGLRSPAGEVYPADGLLQELVRCDVPLTLGSDAHDPTEVGCAVGEVTQQLTELGVRRLIGFCCGKPHEIPL